MNKQRYRIVEVNENGKIHYEIQYTISVLFFFTVWETYTGKAEYAAVKFGTLREAEDVIKAWQKSFFTKKIINIK
jgi:hypothetical protein